MSRFALHVAAAAIMAVAAGAPSETLAQKTTLAVGVYAGDAGRLDPHVSNTGQDKMLFNWMFSGLVRIQPGRASPEFIEPDLAESWTSSQQGTEWVFKLRQGAQCHHGYGELTAEDIVFSLNRAANPATSSFSADYQAFKSIEAVDKHTVKITLKQPIPSLLGLVTNYNGGYIVCKKAVEELGNGFSTRPIGTGPFQFAEYQPQRFVRLTANEAYFRGKPKLKDIVFRFLPSASSRDLAFQSGEIDVNAGVRTSDWVERMRKLPNTTVAIVEPAQVYNLYLNTTVKPLDDIRVRQAIASGIDPSVVVKMSGEVSKKARSVIPSDNVGFLADAKLLPYDPEKARALLAEAGYKDGLTIRIGVTTSGTLRPQMEVIQAQLRKVGINLDIQAVEHSTWMSQLREDRWPIIGYSAARFPIADVYLTQFFHSDSTVGTPTAVTNFSHCNVADREIEEARSEQDPEKQKALWREAQRKIIAAVCAVPIEENFLTWAYKSNLALGYEFKGSLNLSPPVTELTHFSN
jgi:peptide/nickel transport system substrate-binding protein